LSVLQAAPVPSPLPSPSATAPPKTIEYGYEVPTLRAATTYLVTYEPSPHAVCFPIDLSSFTTK
jgi:hypothetical protein